jgi:hypothetical protein
MANFAGGHDTWAIQVASDGTGLTQAVTVTSATGNSTTVFGSQTRAIQVVVAGTVSSNAVVFVKPYTTGATVSQATSTTDAAVPINWVYQMKINPGQRLSLISGDATASYRCYITELSD